MTKHPFRQMRETLRLTQAQCALLLAVEGLGYNQQDYGLFYVMLEMSHRADGRTYPQAIAEVVAWLRFYRRLVDKIAPVASDLPAQCEAEWVKLSAGYEGLLGEVQPLKQ